jgi:hypothetical protein
MSMIHEGAGREYFHKTPGRFWSCSQLLPQINPFANRSPGEARCVGQLPGLVGRTLERGVLRRLAQAGSLKLSALDNSEFLADLIQRPGVAGHENHHQGQQRYHHDDREKAALVPAAPAFRFLGIGFHGAVGFGGTA